MEWKVSSPAPRDKSRSPAGMAKSPAPRNKLRVSEWQGDIAHHSVANWSDGPVGKRKVLNFPDRHESGQGTARQHSRRPQYKTLVHWS